MGVILDFDTNTNLPIRVVIVHDIRFVSPVCIVTFPNDRDLSFLPKETFVLGGLEWEPASVKRVHISGYAFSVMGYPKELCSSVSASHSSLKGLTSAMKIKFADGAVDLKLEFPLRNLLLGPLLYKYRYESMEQNLSNLNKSLFLYYDSRGLYCNTFESMVKEKSADIEAGVLVNTITSDDVDDHALVSYIQDHPPKVRTYAKWITTFFGRKVDYKCNFGLVLGRHYNLDVGGTGLDKMLLIRQKYDSGNSQEWQLTFGRLEV